MKYQHLSLSTTFNLCLLSFLLVSPVIHAEEMSSMNGPKMQSLMIKMNQMQGCLSAIDSEKFQVAEQAMIQANTEITELCQQQKRDLAQARALKFSAFMQQSPTLKQIERCNQPMRDLVPNMPLMNQAQAVLAKQNICDVMSPHP